MESKRTILLVDDVAMFRDLGALFLARSGRVVTASSGEEALERVRNEKPDILLVDLNMPGIDGEAVCRFVKNDPELSEIPVIMLVSANNPEERGRAVRAGADDVLSKPLARVVLIETVNRFLRDPHVRALPRIPIVAPVDFRVVDAVHQGVVRNISRGGVFIETREMVPCAAEVSLHFILPETITEFTPTAQVVWNRQIAASSDLLPPGAGMRFLDIDDQMVRSLEEYVLDRLDPAATPQEIVA